MVFRGLEQHARGPNGLSRWRRSLRAHSDLGIFQGGVCISKICKVGPRHGMKCIRGDKVHYCRTYGGPEALIVSLVGSKGTRGVHRCSVTLIGLSDGK